MLFLPPNIDNNTCQGLQDREASRPLRSESLVSLLVGLSCTLWILFLVSIPVTYFLKDDPRFHKIRPFSLTTTLMMVAMFYVFGCLFPDAFDGFPCAAVLFIHVFGSAVATSVTAARALVFVIETQYSILIANNQVVISDTASVASSSSHKGDLDPAGFFHALAEVLRLGFALRDVRSMSLNTLSQIRNLYLSIFLAISTPPFLVFLIAVLIVPEYRAGCTNCPITVEFLAIVLASPTIFLFFITRLIYLGAIAKQDEQEVMKELFLSICLAPHWIYIGYALDIADPNNVAFNRNFSWQVLTCLGPFFFWVTSVLIQVVKAVQYRRLSRERLTSRPGSISPKNFLEEIGQDAVEKKEFYGFASSRYTMELLNFIEDVKSYKGHFDSQSDRWRKSNARKLVNTYIKIGSTQEVNISSKQRDEILAVNIDESPIPKLFVMFDVAWNEVTHMVITGVWADFRSVKMRRLKLAQESAVVASSA